MVRAFPRSQRGFHPQSPCGVHGVLNATRPRSAARPARSSTHAHAQHAPPPAHEANHVGALSFDRLRRKKSPLAGTTRCGTGPPRQQHTAQAPVPHRGAAVHAATPNPAKKKAPENGVEIPPTPRGCKVGPTAQPCTPQRTTLSVGGPGGRGLFFRRTRNRGFVNLPVAATGCAGEQAPPRVATAGRMSLGGPGGAVFFAEPGTIDSCTCQWQQRAAPEDRLLRGSQELWPPTLPPAPQTPAVAALLQDQWSSSSGLCSHPGVSVSADPGGACGAADSVVKGSERQAVARGRTLFTRWLDLSCLSPRAEEKRPCV